MLEAKYYRDYGHNYMILQCEQQETVRSYQYKILTSGKIGEILKCTVRYINGSTYFYYDISSRTTLDSLYRGKKMSYVQVQDFLWQIHGIYEKLAGYFMEEARLVLLPEHIYYDITYKKYVGLYYPDYRPDGFNAYKVLTDFLLEHIDTDDRNLAEKMYRICELAEEECFFIEDALRVLEENEEPTKATIQNVAWEETHDSVIDRTEAFGIVEDLSERKEYERKQPKKNLFYPVFAALSALGIVGAIAGYSLFELTQREEIIIYGVIVALSICVLLCIIGILADSKKKASTDRKSAEETGEEYFSDFNEELYGEPREKQSADYPVGAGMLPLGQVISRDMDLEMAGYHPVFARTEHNAGRPLHNAKFSHAEDIGNYGDTVFFDENAVKEYKLYAMDKKNKSHIELKQFPCTIGKMAGCVDHVLPDNSISRIHARFDMQGEKVLLTDMNSTNGTYKNGLRMQPQETVEIEPGDEVRFGNLNYCYR